MINGNLPWHFSKTKVCAVGKETVAYSSVLAGKTPWAGGLVGHGPWGQRVGHDSAPEPERGSMCPSPGGQCKLWPHPCPLLSAAHSHLCHACEMLIYLGTPSMFPCIGSGLKHCGCSSSLLCC